MGFPNTRQQSRKPRGVKDQENTRKTLSSHPRPTVVAPGPSITSQQQKKGQDFDMSTPRSASPVPRLALQIPDQHPAIASTMKILKRHTVPYPSPSSSPNISPPAPARSYTHPVGKDLEKHQQRYMNRMHSKLEPHLKALDPAQRMSKEPQKESGPEDEPVPTFFISPGASNYPDDNDMLHEEFVAIGDLDDHDLDYIMRDSGFQTAEYMPDPEEPIQEPIQGPIQKLLVTVDSPSEHQQVSSHPQSATAQGLLVAPVVQGPISDSGVGSTMGSPGTLTSNCANAELQGFATDCSVTNALSGHARKISATSSLETEAGLGNGSLMGRPSIVPESGSSYTVAPCQELTPPSSATLSPKSFHATQPELSKTMMDLESIHAIERHLITPMTNNLEFVGLKGVLSSAKEKMYQGQIRCLRDVEKYVMNMVNKTCSNVPPKNLFNALFNGIQNAYPDVHEKDRVRETDTPYTKNYFLDQLDIVSGGAMHYSGAQQRVSKRRLSIDAEASVAKRPMITATSFNSQGPFVKPVAKLRQNNPSKQQLEILTQVPPEVYNSCQLVGHPHSHIGNNSTFQFDENTKNTTAQTQSCDVRAYYQPTISQSWQPSGQLAMPTPMVNSNDGYSPASLQTSLTAASALPLVGFAMSPSEPTSAVSAGSPLHSSPISRANSKEPPNYSCEFCQKSFPRPCDLTKHRKTHDRPFKCDDVNCKYYTEGFPTNKEKERHQNDIHALNSKEWKCEFAPCPYKSKRESNCKQHMEKAHQYVYRRMKRNPRRRDQGVAVTPTRRKKNPSITNESQSSTPVMPNGNLEVLPQPSDFPLFLDHFLGPSQLPVGSFSWPSPLTNTTDYESPLSIVPNDFEDYRAGSRTNPMMTNDWIMYENADNSVHQYRSTSDFQHNFHPTGFIGNGSEWNLDSDTVD